MYLGKVSHFKIDLLLGPLFVDRAGWSYQRNFNVQRQNWVCIYNFEHGEDDISEFVEFKKITKYEKTIYKVELHEYITMTILRDSYMLQTN